MIETVRASETSVYFNETPRSYLLLLALMCSEVIVEQQCAPKMGIKGLMTHGYAGCLPP
jgi:hypothetical protein